MFLNMYCYLMFIPLTSISSFMIMFTTSWFSKWMIMEINMISFLSLMIFEKNMNSEIPLNYFLIQSVSSYIFMMSNIMMDFSNNSMIYSIIMFMSLLTKMGLPPFYMWYLKIMKNLSWSNFFTMSTIQKFIPLIIINDMFNKIKNLLMLNIMMMSITSISLMMSLTALQQMNMKLIMCYSSMIQMSWIILLSLTNEMLFYMYFIIYMIINYSMCQIFQKFNIKYMNNLNLIKFKMKWKYFLLFLMMFSMAGIPPSMGFLFKWFSIQIMSNKLTFFINLSMILISLISLLFYFRIMYMSLLNPSISIKMNFIKIKFMNKFKVNLILFNWFMIWMIMMFEMF